MQLYVNMLCHNASVSLMFLSGFCTPQSLFSHFLIAVFISLITKGDLGLNPKIESKYDMHITDLMCETAKHVAHQS